MNTLHVFENTAQAKYCFVTSYSTDYFLLLTIFFRRQFRASEEKKKKFYSPAIKNRIWEDFPNLASLLRFRRLFTFLTWTDSVTLLSNWRELWLLLFIFYVQCYVRNTCPKILEREAWYSASEYPHHSAFTDLPLTAPLPSTIPHTPFHSPVKSLYIFVWLQRVVWGEKGFGLSWVSPQ